MKEKNLRFEPYIKPDYVILFERTKEATGLSYGAILENILLESETFLKLYENYYEAPDKELSKIFFSAK